MLQLPQKSRAIGDCTYKVTLLSAGEGLPVNALLLRVLGPAVATLAGELPDARSLADMPWAALAKAFNSAIYNLDAKDLRTLVDAFAPKTWVKLPDGKEPLLSDVFDLHFAGKYVRMYRWLAFCLECNFADFLDTLPANVLRPKAPEPSPSL
jgi:hypothetical protein